MTAGFAALSLPAMLTLAEDAHARHLAGAPFKHLTAAEAIEIEAIAAQIVPTDDAPGAREAGVIYFIDGVLGTTDKEALPTLRSGLEDLTVRAKAKDASRFSDLAGAVQIGLLKEIEETEFFGIVRFLTMAGMFAHPSYGGNRDRVGWKLIGFDDRHFWQPPFGHYDADYVDPYRDAK